MYQYIENFVSFIVFDLIMSQHAVAMATPAGKKQQVIVTNISDQLTEQMLRSVACRLGELWRPSLNRDGVSRERLILSQPPRFQPTPHHATYGLGISLRNAAK